MQMESFNNKLNYTILIVDDEKSLVRLISKTLERNGFHAKGIENCDEAIEYATQHCDILMLLDYVMPKMNGKQIIESINGKGCNIPFIIMTGYGDQRVALDMMKLGARDYINKDAGFVDILPQVVNKAIEELAQEKKLAKAEDELQEYQNNLKSLASKLALTAENERKLIAIELHDNILQSLALAKMQLAVLEKSVQKNDILDNIRGIQEYISSSIRTIRSLISELSPPILQNMGLASALDWMLGEFKKQHGWRTRFYDDSNEKLIKDEMRNTLFALVKECLFNIAKHANAKNVIITLKRENHSISIIVEDDGVGFEVHEKLTGPSEKGGFGLFSIRERMEFLGGDIKIESEPGNGTKIILTIPLGIHSTEH